MPKINFTEAEARLIAAIKDGINQNLKRPMANNDEGEVQVAYDEATGIIYCNVTGYRFEIHIES